MKTTAGIEPVDTVWFILHSVGWIVLVWLMIRAWQQERHWDMVFYGIVLLLLD